MRRDACRRRSFRSPSPRPRRRVRIVLSAARSFFISAVGWTLLAILLWYAGGDRLGSWIGLPPLPAGAEPIIGASVFWSPPFLWFYIYYTLAVVLFAGFWFVYRPHRWQLWSVLGTALIVFNTYFSVQVSVAINAWYGPFYDLIQQALARPR